MDTDLFSRVIRPEEAAVAADLATASAALAAHLRAAGAGPRTVSRAELVLEELALNALRHGGAGSVALSAGREAEGWVLRLEDAGRAFDPTRAALPDAAGAEGRGGLGLKLVRRTAQALRYARVAGCNRVEVVLPPE